MNKIQVQKKKKKKYSGKDDFKNSNNENCSHQSIMVRFTSTLDTKNFAPKYFKTMVEI
jgi:hypothetical protein